MRRQKEGNKVLKLIAAQQSNEDYALRDNRKYRVTLGIVQTQRRVRDNHFRRT